MATRSIVRMFDHVSDAFRAVHELERAGIGGDRVSVVANNREGWYDKDEGLRYDRLARRDGKKDADGDGADDRVEGAGSGAATGAVLGGGAGLLAGLGMLAIPGLGPIVAAGWLASTATGALAGAVAGGVVGGLVGALTDAGVDREHAEVYAEGVRRGAALLVVRAEGDEADRAEAILDRMPTANVDERRNYYRQDGWTGYDSSAPEYTEEEIARERSRWPMSHSSMSGVR